MSMRDDMEAAEQRAVEARSGRHDAFAADAAAMPAVDLAAALRTIVELKRPPYDARQRHALIKEAARRLEETGC